MKKLEGEYSKPKRPVKDKEGKTITEIQEQGNRWLGYFEELLNGPDIEARHTNLSTDVTPPTVEEIRVAIRQIRQNPVGVRLRDQKAGFRKDQLYTDEIAKLRFIVKQLIE
ncbi:unnamed protein product [Schistosoma curassoni]|uniref:Reverse transcriptase domain-containing protein n=1 Tax=Schistosoma curassoni TaxID=6186 RepID=A0A183KV59_9TREM|nr:unnamed protein product [Schistosoma curassoni]